MVNRIYLAAATVISGISLAVGAAVVPAGNQPVEKPTTQPTVSSDALEQACLEVDQIMYQFVGPALQSLMDTPESRQSTASVLREQAPNFERLADSLGDGEGAVAFTNFSNTANDLAGALESDASADEVTVYFDEFNRRGAEMSSACFEVFESLSTP